MKKIFLSTSFAMCLACASFLSPPVSAATLDEVLAAMDKSSVSFEDMSARLTRVDHTAVIDDTSEESGRIRMKRSKSGDFRMLIDFSDPDPRTVSFAERRAEIFYPKIKTVQVYDLGKYRNLIDQFLLLGFGSSGSELKKNYDLKVSGEEKVGGETTTRLELIPKSASAREHLTKVELWISSAGYPLRQKFHRPSGDYTLATYSDLKINTNLSDDTLKLKLPSGVKRQYPQK